MRTPLDAVSLAIEIRQMLGRPYWSDGNAVYVSACVGVVTKVEDSDSKALVQMASAATHQAKNLAGGWALGSAHRRRHTSSRDELGVVSDLRAAIEDGNLTVAYQPVVEGRERLSGPAVRKRRRCRSPRPSRLPRFLRLSSMRVSSYSK
jgi:predicted signal transduction protein with EAL and GGDEF domain